MLRQIILSALIAAVSVSFVDGVTPATINLSTICKANGTVPVPIYLPCNKLSAYRAGTIQLTSFPSYSCNFTLTINKSSCSSDDLYAIYYNLKAFSLNLNDSVNVYENDALVKHLPGGYQTPLYARSRDQLLSRYSQKPTLNFRFSAVNKTDNTTQHTRRYLMFDYVVLREKYSSNFESFCAALNGSILDRHYCDPSLIICPLRYTPSVGLNPVTAIPMVSNLPYCQSLFPSPMLTPTISPYWYPTLRPIPNYSSSSYSSSSSSNLETYQIVFVVFLCIALVIALLRMCVYCFCRTTGTGTTTSRTTRSIDPQPLVIDGNGHVVDTGPKISTVSGNYFGAPPSYDSVCPANGPPSQDVAHC